MYSRACRFASAAEIVDVNVLVLPLGQIFVFLQVGQLNSRAFRFASACETVDSNSRAPLPHGFVAVYTGGGGGAGQLQRFACACASACEMFEVKVFDRPLGHDLVTDPQGSASAAMRFASGCPTYEVNVSPHWRAVQLGQVARAALPSASACETDDVNRCRPLGQDL